MLHIDVQTSMPGKANDRQCPKLRFTYWSDVFWSSFRCLMAGHVSS